MPSATQMQPHINALNQAAAQSEEAVITKAREIARAQLASTAYANRQRTDREYIADLYQVFWQRVPDQSGWEHWTREVSVRGRESALMRFSTSTAFKEMASTLYREMLWLVSDHLGTPRMIVERTGALSGIRRHDYLPFGEEIQAGVGGRTTNQGYSQFDGVRQRYAGAERDDETGLDFMQARYYARTQGRFTSPDNFLNDTSALDPASWNLYAYVRNNPLRYTDPTGERIYVGDVTGADRDELLRRVNYTYGCDGCVGVDDDGFLTVDTQGLNQDVLNATQFLTGAINDQLRFFAVEVTHDNPDVAFGDAGGATVGVINPANGVLTSALRIRLDFGDDRRVTGNAEAREAFLNTVFAHEIRHLYPNSASDPSGDDGRRTRGPVVNDINEILLARGLPLRERYSAVPVQRGGDIVELTHGRARLDRTNNPDRRGGDGIRVTNEANRTIRWSSRNVGGRGVN